MSVNPSPESAEKGLPTGWPICTRHRGTRHNGHVGNEDYSDGSAAWKYVGRYGDATCSCCDPSVGFPCVLTPEVGAP